MSTEPNSADDLPIYVGAWTNWSRGAVMGATLTLKKQDADILIAITAFFIAYVATRFWRIICFCFHRLYSNSNPRDAVHHQRQAILRNSSSAENGVYLLLRLMWTNRYSKQSYRPLSATSVGIICVVAFTAAGTYSSRISTAPGDEVLISSSSCGLSYPPGSVNKILEDAYNAYVAYSAEVIDSAANYAQQCYSNNNAGLDCDRYVKKQIKAAVDLKAPCPFSEVMCRNSSANIRIDSGYLNSHEHFGINSPTSQRVLWRNVLHCAPLVTAGFSSQKTTLSGNLTVYHYGSTILETTLDYMYAAEAVESQYLKQLDTQRIVSYFPLDLQVFVAAVKDKTAYAAASAFSPINLITRQDSDIYIVFISGNGVIYTYPTTDEWYRVEENSIDFWVNGGNGNGTIWAKQGYLPREPASPLGCTDQYQFCNAALMGTSGCGPLASLRDAVAGASHFFDTNYLDFSASVVSGIANEEASAMLVYFAGRSFGIQRSFYAVLSKLGASALLSHRTLAGALQGPLASNQWQLDVSHIWDVTMAARQAQFVDGTHAPTDDPSISLSWINYTSPALKKLCDNQKIRSTAYGSFNIFGLCFTFIMGFVLILISYILEPISACLNKRTGHNKYAHLEWITNSTLQLQRLAHEEMGLGTWSKCADLIPVTKEDELLGCLDITDPERPILQVPVKESEEPGPDQAHSANGDPETTPVDGDNHSAVTPIQGPEKPPDIVINEDAEVESQEHVVVEVDMITDVADSPVDTTDTTQALHRA